MGNELGSKPLSTTRLTRGLACGVAAFAMIAGLGLAPCGTSPAYAAPADESVSYIGSDVLSARDASERAEEASEETPPAEDLAIQGQLIVEMFPNVDEDVVLATAIGDSGMTVAKSLMPKTDAYGGIYLVNVPAGMELQDAKAKLLENTQIANVSYDIILQAEGTCTVTDQGASFLNAEAALSNDTAITNGAKWEAKSEFMDFEGTWKVASDAGWKDSSSVTVAVIDSGIATTHADLKDNIVATYDATGQSDPSDILSSGHGTAVAGIISARTNNGVGSASIAYNAKLLPIKVYQKVDDKGNIGAPLSVVLNSLNWLIENDETLGKTPADAYNVKVVNLSFGRPSDKISDSDAKTGITNAIGRLWDKGIVVVNSMGNNTDNGSTVELPYKHWPTDTVADKCVGVIALDQDANVAGKYKRDSQSNYNTSESTLVGKISAPGHNIYTTAKNGGYLTNFTGTSAATPQVSSLLALMYAVSPDMTPATAVGLLYDNATSLGSKQEYGYGAINPKAVIQDLVKEESVATDRLEELKDGMTASVDDTKLSDFNYTKTDYTKDYGKIPATQQLPSQVTITVPKGWIVTANGSNPVTDTDDKAVASDGTTTGKRTRKLEYTVKTDDGTVSQTYAFTFKGSYEDTSTRYENVLKDIKLQIEGKEYPQFAIGTRSYRIVKNSQTELNATETALENGTLLKFSGLPAGWTQKVTGPEEHLDKSDNGNGTVTNKATFKYVVTLSDGGKASIQYDVVFYAESVEKDPNAGSVTTRETPLDAESNPILDTEKNPSKSSSQKPMQSATPLQAPSSASSNASSDSKAMQVASQTQSQGSSGNTSNTSQQNQTQQQGQQQQQQTQRQQQKSTTITQTGDADALIAASTLAIGSIALATVARGRRDRRA